MGAGAFAAEAGAHAGGTTVAEVEVRRVRAAEAGYDGWGAVQLDAEEYCDGLA